VLDVNNNPANPIINTRSFGEDPQLVARLGAAYVRGCQSAGVIATLKHFPGHGDTSQDTHVYLPALHFDEARLHATELVPFKAAIGAGAKAVMTAHIALPQIEATNRPATLSRKIITEFLREQLGFNGLVVTDAFTMQGITDHYGQEEAAVLAAQAGADMLLIPADTAQVHRRLVQAVANGEVAREQIHAAVRRILTAKAELNLHVSRLVPLEKIMRLIGAPESQNIAEKISAEALTLLEHDGRTLPLRPQPPKRIFALVISNALQPGDGAYLQECLGNRGHQVEALSFLHEPAPAALARAHEQCREAELVLVAMYLSVGAWKGALRIPAVAYDFMNAAQAKRKPMLAVSFGDPYVFEHLPAMSASLCAYNGGRTMEGLVARALAGELRLHGKLPVTIPGRFPFGAGLEFGV
jgi:beta-N-acetylhexosaminidase